MPAEIDMTGMKYGRLTAIKRTGTSKHKKPIWLFDCECGVQKEIVAEAVRSGLVVSCGCYNREKSKAKTRCRNPNYHSFHRYGGL